MLYSIVNYKSNYFPGSTNYLKQSFGTPGTTIVLDGYLKRLEFNAEMTVIMPKEQRQFLENDE